MIDSKQSATAETAEDDAVIGRALVRSLLVIVPVLIAVAVTIVILSRPQKAPQAIETDYVGAQPRNTAVTELPVVRFTDITKESGLTFVHTNGAAGDKLLPETMGGGVAFLDYDNDNDQDVLLVNSSHWPDRSSDTTQLPTMALFENDGSGKFTNVTQRAGLDFSMYGMGVAVGDFDNDGWRDVFITGVHENRLLHNQQGVFRDVTEAAGVAGKNDQWGASCGWFDYDRDGLLDLFVCNYIRWDRKTDFELGSTLDGVNRAYGPPTQFQGDFPLLYRNEGEGKFTDVSREMGIQIKNRLTGVPVCKSLGVVFTDIDDDGWTDIIVANDTVQNLVFRNEGGKRFLEQGALAGLAFDGQGQARGAMGIDAASFRDDDSLGVAIGNFANEPTSLYVARSGRATFSDEAMATGLGPQTKHALTFGLFFFDVDLDGRLDVFAANGHLEEDINRTQKTQHYEQSPQLFWNAGRDQRTEFVPLTQSQTGPDLHHPMVGRGAAYADIDNDGDLDILVTAAGRAPRLLRNDQTLGHYWLRVRLVGRSCNRDAIGAVIVAEAGGRQLVRHVSCTRSYLSQVELPVTFGLGKTQSVDSLVIHWPGGLQQRVERPAVNRVIEIKQLRHP